MTDFFHTRILDPPTLVVTGLMRNGVWLAEVGRMERPVSNLRFPRSCLDALAPGAVLEVGARRSLVGDGCGGLALAPSPHHGSWSFTVGAHG